MSSYQHNHSFSNKYKNLKTTAIQQRAKDNFTTSEDISEHLLLPELSSELSSKKIVIRQQQLCKRCLRCLLWCLFILSPMSLPPYVFSDSGLGICRCRVFVRCPAGFADPVVAPGTLKILPAFQAGDDDGYLPTPPQTDLLRCAFATGFHVFLRHLL